MSPKTIYFDGACLPVNPGGVACWGVVAVSDGKVVKEKAGIASRKGTNNIAEWRGLIEAIKLAKELSWKKIRILGDSKLVVYQFNGIWYIHKKHLRKLCVEAKKEAKDLFVTVEWIPRERNLADPVCHRAYVEDFESQIRKRAEKEAPKYSVGKKGDVIVVRKENGKSYTLTLDPIYCSCPFFRKMMSYPLLRRSGIVVRCKHFFVAEILLGKETVSIS